MSGMLTENQKKLLVLFKTAIENERAAQQLYSEALALCEDESLKKIIQSLLAEESNHEQALIRKYGELRAIGEYRDPA